MCYICEDRDPNPQYHGYCEFCPAFDDAKVESPQTYMLGNDDDTEVYEEFNSDTEELLATIGC